MKDLELDKEYQKGSKGEKVGLIQEWLCLQGYHTRIDKDFGPATDTAVRGFQQDKGIAVNGIVGDETFVQLVLPMSNALNPIAPNGRSLGMMVVAYAEQHLKQSPREIGGQNKGPWVRLYMNGNEGPEWPWCAGFACFILTQACETLGVPLPMTASVSCDFLAAEARNNGLLLSEPPGAERKRITLGSLFLVKRTATDWTHTGIVVEGGEDVFETIEGNTNDDGSREGYEVCKRFRGYKDKDFILL